MAPSWITEVIATGTRDGKPFKAIHRYGLRPTTSTSPACLPPQMPCRDWQESVGATASQKPGGYESWHWIRDTQLNEDDHRYRGNGAGVMEALRTAAMNLLRLTGFGSIREGLQAVMHDITALLAMATRQSRARPA